MFLLRTKIISNTPRLKSKCLKNVMYQTIIHSFGRALADVNCYCKMTSVMALDGVTSFSRKNDVSNACKRN